MWSRRAYILRGYSVFARAFKLVFILLAIVVVSPRLGAQSHVPVASAQGTLDLPAYRELVQTAARASWQQQPPSAPGASLTTLVQVDMLPLALVGQSMSHAERQAYVAEVAAAQAQVAAEVGALGGRVVASFQHASTGLVVQTDTADLQALGNLPNVSAVMRVGDYVVDQSAPAATASSPAEIAALIGADEVRQRGNDGRGIDVALIDTGVDYTHARLGGSGDVNDYRRAACGDASISPGTAGCNATLAPPADLFPTTKVRGGYDYVGDIWPNPDPRCQTALVCGYSDPNPIDLNGHGTHVADIAAGLPLAADGSDSGIAPGAKLWVYKACNGEAGRCNGTALIRAIDDALDLDNSDQPGGCVPGVDAGCLAYDPADIINLSLSFSYGQPEDAVTLFANLASYYGSLVIAAAGNEGNKPYIVGSPATADGALAVAESTLPGAPIAALLAGGRPIDAMHQSWSGMALEGQLALRYGDGDANLNGCAPLAAWQGALLLERGGCTNEVKASNAAAAGAQLLLVADNARSTVPPVLNGGASPLAVYSLTRTEAVRLRSALQAGPLAINVEVSSAEGERIAANASRGPRIPDNAIKPDLAAPGAILSAQAGSGSASSSFGGSSGSAPVATGVAALIIQQLERLGASDENPGLADAPEIPLSLAPLVKTVLMNNALGDLRTDAGQLAPITLQGAGRINALNSFLGRTLAMDATEMIALLNATPALASCSVQPFIDLYNYLLFRITPPCGSAYPAGDTLYQAWNAQTGSLSFGYQPAVGYQELQRQVVVINYSRKPRSYTLSTDLRYTNDEGRGVAVSVSPASFSLEGGGATVVTMTMTISPRALPDWTLNGGELGNRGDDTCDSPTPELVCPSLTLFEVDGALTVDGGANNRINVPFHVLPRKTADVSVSRIDETQVVLSNRSTFKDGEVEPFALVDISPNKCDTRSGLCTDVDYTPGAFPGSGQSPVDIHLVGLRSYSVAGLNERFGLPPAPTGALADELVEFAITVYDKPYRASPNFPVQFEVVVDSDANGAGDYVVFNADLGEGNDGRSAVFVRDINPADGTQPTAPYLYTVADFNSQNWVLPVPAAAVGLRSDQPFRFYVLASDAYFRGDATQPWDCSPAPTGACGSSLHTMQTGALRFQPSALDLVVPAESRSELGFSEGDNDASSPSQIGLLLLFRDAQPGREAASVRIR